MHYNHIKHIQTMTLRGLEGYSKVAQSSSNSFQHLLLMFTKHTTRIMLILVIKLVRQNTKEKQEIKICKK